MKTLSTFCLSAAIAGLAPMAWAQHDHPDHNHSHGQPLPAAPGASAEPSGGNEWFEWTKLDLGTFFEEEDAIGTFKFTNPHSETHKLSKLVPSCSCAKALVRVGDRKYTVGANKVLYRVEDNDDGTQSKIRVEHIDVEPEQSGELEVHMSLTGFKGKKDATLGLELSDEDLSSVSLSWSATAATFFHVNPPEVNLNEMSWSDTREFQFTVTSPLKEDFNITGHENLEPGMKVEYSKNMRDGKAEWTVRGSYGPGAREPGGGMIVLKTDTKQNATARVVAFVKGPLTMVPGGFVGLGHIKKDEGKEVEITLTPNGEFDLQVEKLEIVRFGLRDEDQRKFVEFDHEKRDSNVVVKIRVLEGMKPAYLTGVLKIHLNHPGAKSKEVMFNGFVR